MSSVINPVPTLTNKQIEQFWAKVDRRGPDECWPWIGASHQIRASKSRYGVWKINSNTLTMRPHRVAYTLLVGPISTELTLDHVAERCSLGGLCCNPAHLDPVTRGVNARRYYRSRTHCKRGHPIEQHGRPCRQCRTLCKREERAAKPQRDALKETA